MPGRSFHQNPRGGCSSIGWSPRGDFDGSFSPASSPPRSIKRTGQPGARGGGFSRSAVLAPETPDDSDERTFVKKQKPGQGPLAGVPLLGYIRSHIDLDLE